MFGSMKLDPEATPDQTAWDKGYNKFNFRINLLLGLLIAVCLLGIFWASTFAMPGFEILSLPKSDPKYSVAKESLLTSLNILISLFVGLMIVWWPLNRISHRYTDKIGSRPTVN